ncbi:hypothetical protein BSKO_03812 [Bryopsis sp. KO-2023]|nr:hypothetical protein BSKO_03812 [Bryopsis sp. KO-2023]
MSDDDDYYQDDFEDYEDDFEEEEPEIEAPPPTSQLSLDRQSTDGRGTIAASLNIPNLAIDSSNGPAKPVPPHKGFLPTKAALGPSDAQRAILQQRSARWKSLMSRIRLEVMEWDNVFEMPPMTPYDLYMRGLGQYATRRVASTQTGDDWHTEEVQTEEIEHTTQRCQVPDDFGKSSWELEQDKEVDAASKGKNKRKKNAMSDLTFDESNLKLKGFIQKATAMVSAILSGEEHKAMPSILFTSSWCFNGISDGSLSLNTQEFTPRGSIISMSLAAGAKPLLLAAHGMSNDDHIKVTGMQEGGVCMWDLQEMDEINHQNNDSSVKTLRATYTTEYSPDHDTTAPVTSIFACNARDSGSNIMAEGEAKKWSSPNDRTNVELICLSAWGCVTIMGVRELNDMDAFSLQQIDWGLRIGARARLVKITTGIPLGKSMLQQKAGVPPPEEQPTMCMTPLPTNPDQFLVGSDGGRILRGAKLGDIAAPKQFSPFEDASRRKHKCLGHFNSSVISLDASPTVNGLFVAGHTNSLITLHHLHREGAVRSWEGLACGDVVFTRFLPRTANILFALFSTAELCCIDLLGEGLGLVSKVSVEKNGVRVTACDIEDRGTAVENDCVSFAIGYEDGEIQVHRIAHGLLQQQDPGRDAAVLRSIGE